MLPNIMYTKKHRSPASSLLAAMLMGGGLGAAAAWPKALFAQATTLPAPGSAQPKADAPVQRAKWGERVASRGWWNQAVFYEVFVRSFKDSATGPLANDGVGDIQGLIEKLDYLNDGKGDQGSSLGVTALWLMPICQSPTYHGYDTTDYFTINKDFGTNDDFKRLIAECEKRGIKVILDFVPNHLSNKHPWFTRAIDPKSPYHDWFIWSDKDPAWKGPWGQRVWHKEPTSGQFYYGLFSHTMPDLNFRNAAVSKEFKDIARFWLSDMGAAGLRLDAIRHLIEDGQIQENTPETHRWLNEFRTACKDANERAFLVGEVWSNTDAIAGYIAGSSPKGGADAGDQLDSCFEFELSSAMFEALEKGDATKLARQIELTVAKIARNQASVFLANHDMTRTMTRLKGDDNRARLAAMLMFTMPGIPFIYYGEELGMVGDKPDEKIRTPMQWSADKNGGFTSAKPWALLNRDHRAVNVAMQEVNPASLLSLYKQLIKLRKSNAALREGETAAWSITRAPGLLVVVRQGMLINNKRTPAVVGLFNFTDNEAVIPAINTPALGFPTTDPDKVKARLIASSRHDYTPTAIPPRLATTTEPDGIEPTSAVGWVVLEGGRLKGRTGVWVEVHTD